jgi:hypothetical protein
MLFWVIDQDAPIKKCILSLFHNVIIFFRKSIFYMTYIKNKKTILKHKNCLHTQITKRTYLRKTLCASKCLGIHLGVSSPVDMFAEGKHKYTVMRAEGGGLGFLILS